MLFYWLRHHRLVFNKEPPCPTAVATAESPRDLLFKEPFRTRSTPIWKFEDFSMHGCNFNNLVLLWSKWSRQTSGKKKNRPISDVNSLLGQCNSEVSPPPKPPPPCRVSLLWRKPKHSSGCLNWKSQKVLRRGGNGVYRWCTSPHTFLQTAISHAQFLLVWQLFRVT